MNVRSWFLSPRGQLSVVFAPLACLMLSLGLAGCSSAPPTPPKVEDPPKTKKIEEPPKKAEDPPKKADPPEKPPEKKAPDTPPDPTKGNGKTDPGDTPKVVLPGPSRWKVLATLEQKQRAVGLAFSVDCDLLAVGGGGPPGGEEVRIKPPPAIRLYKTSDWSSAGDLLGHTENVAAVAFSPDKKSLVSAGGKLTRDAEVKVWDLASKLPITQLRATGGVIGVLVFDPAGNILFTGGESPIIKLWDFSTGKLPQGAKPFETLLGHDQYLTALALSPDGKYLASGSADLSLRLWVVAEGRVRTMFRGHGRQVNSAAFSPKGEYLASAAGNGEVKIWDVGVVSEKTSLKVDPPRMLLSVAFSPDGQWLVASGADGKVTIWDFPSWKLSETLKEHPDFVNQVVFSPDGRFLAGAGEDGRVVIWAVPK